MTTTAPPFKMTPMYEQYLGIKKEYPDTILFYRMGDFYELFFEDAEITARELQLALTSRSKDEGGVPMCGIPWHAAEAYFGQMVNKGYRVAVCDQVEDPKATKGLVKRAVTRVITAGTALEEMNLQAKEHNYLGAVYFKDGLGAFAWLDASTGTWTGLETNKEAELWQWVYKIEPSELLVPAGFSVPEVLQMQGHTQVVNVPFASHFDEKRAVQRVLDAQKVQELSALGLEKKPTLVCVCGALLAYLEQNQKCLPHYLSSFQPLDMSHYMVVDEVTERNLEIFRRYDGRKGIGTLWHELDECLTPMGGRLLEERIRYPFKEIKRIHAHQAVVAYFAERNVVRENVRQALKKIYDLERLSIRISVNRFLPRDFIALRDSVQFLPELLHLIQKNENGHLVHGEHEYDALPAAFGRLLRQWDNCEDIAEILANSLRDDVPNQITDGMLFKLGYDAELDEILDIIENAENKLSDLLKKEQEYTKVSKLKIGYNRVFGYYFEVSKTNQQPLPDYFERRQSLVNAERFITPELKELESKILNASERRNSLEYRLFQELKECINKERPRLLFMASLIAQIDYWQALAQCAVKKSWVMPEVDESEDIYIHEGRHPVVEKVIGKSNFIPNDLTIDNRKRLLLITGPNMAGKSTILRQCAIICILAQMGSFVPATKAKIGIVDRVFSRVGASDNLAQGQSTFMVEMMETARILRQSTKRSLVILDEIGRGTSTFDGLALAWAVVESLIKRSNGCIRTLFATHYHELTSLEAQYSEIYNMSIAIKEWNNEIVFLRRLIPGAADKSYGIEVARLAGVPTPVVQRAKQILAKLEEQRENVGVRIEKVLLPGLEFPTKKADTSLSQKENSPLEHPILKALAKLDPNTLTPLDSLRLVSEWKNLLKNK